MDSCFGKTRFLPNKLLRHDSRTVIIIEESVVHLHVVLLANTIAFLVGITFMLSHRSGESDIIFDART